MTAPARQVWLFECACGRLEVLPVGKGANTIVEAVRAMRRQSWRFSEDGSARCPEKSPKCGAPVEEGKEWRPE